MKVHFHCRTEANIPAKIRSIFAEIAQLVEHDLAKVGVASSSLVFRSKKESIEKSVDSFFIYKTRTRDPSPSLREGRGGVRKRPRHRSHRERESRFPLKKRVHRKIGGLFFYI